MTRYFYLLLVLLVFTGCPGDTDDDGPGPVTFDRQALLTQYADDYRVQYQNLVVVADGLLSFTLGISDDPQPVELDRLGTALDRFYGQWQDILPLVTVAGEDLFLIQRVNSYPTDTEGVLELARNGGDLALPANFDKQGLPALEYLLRGEDGTLLADAGNRAYAVQLARVLLDLVVATNNRWQGDFYNDFIENDGNSVTASLDRMVNDIIFNYERYTRAGKVGIPAGVFSNLPLPDRVEARYSPGLNKLLLQRALRATRRAISGSPTQQFSLEDYLNALDVRRDGELLSTEIGNAFDRVDSAVNALNDDLGEQVVTDNAAMLAAYDEMQRLLVLLKVDMLQALNINVDYVDADGD